MTYKPLRMDKRQQIIDYQNKRVPKKKIARLLGLSKNTVKKYISRNAEQGSTDENVKATCSDSVVQASSLEFARALDIQTRLPELISELGRVGVTRRLLWKEYIAVYPSGYSYCVFCRKLKQYRALQEVTIRIVHKAAYTLSIDFTDKKVSWVDRRTGEVHQAETLVCTMPYSGYTFACAFPSQKQEDFVQGINQALLTK